MSKEDTEKLCEKCTKRKFLLFKVNLINLQETRCNNYKKNPIPRKYHSLWGCIGKYERNPYKNNSGE